MSEFDSKNHWDKVYNTKQTEDVSWYQPIPKMLFNFLEPVKLPRNISILDVGGGDSLLVDQFLEYGFSDISILDISEKAIERAKARLNVKAENVNWIIEDILELKTEKSFDLWHDRAAFHFFTEEKEINKYLEVVKQHLNPGGYLILNTFSDEGPDKCSGLNVQQYSEDSMFELLKNDFYKLEFQKYNHKTPSNSIQNFLFGFFKRKPMNQ